MNRIKELRKGAGVTQTQLAKAMNVRQTTVSMWESQKSYPDMNTAINLAKYFNVSVEYLLGKDDTTTDTEDELNDYLEQLRTRPELRMMFSLTSKATKADVEKAVRIIEAMLSED